MIVQPLMTYDDKVARAIASANQASVAWTWSDWFGHLGDVLAVLYDWRGRPAGKSVRQWLTSLASAEGAHSLTEMLERDETR